MFESQAMKRRDRESNAVKKRLVLAKKQAKKL